MVRLYNNDQGWKLGYTLFVGQPFRKNTSSSRHPYVRLFLESIFEITILFDVQKQGFIFLKLFSKLFSLPWGQIRRGRLHFVLFLDITTKQNKTLKI